MRQEKKKLIFINCVLSSTYRIVLVGLFHA